MSQVQIIKEKLSDGNWICGTWFMDNYIPEYRSRINEIRKEGLMIEARACRQHSHKSKNLQEWRLVPTLSAQLPEAPVSAQDTPVDNLIREIKQVVDNQPLFIQESLL